jgi:hypothetical protein
MLCTLSFDLLTDLCCPKPVFCFKNTTVLLPEGKAFSQGWLSVEIVLSFTDWVNELEGYTNMSFQWFFNLAEGNKSSMTGLTYMFAWTVIKRHHRLTDLHNRYFLTVLETTSLRSRCQQDWSLLRSPSLAFRWPYPPMGFSLCVPISYSNLLLRIQFYGIREPSSDLIWT